MLCRIYLVLVSIAVFAPAALAEPLTVAEVKRDTPVAFDKDILPILRKNCIACHNSSEAQNSLVLETPQSILEGGDAGPAVVAGQSAASLLFKAASHVDKPVMPPAKNMVGAADLTAEQLGLLKLWIDQGAKSDPASAAPKTVAWQPLPRGINPIYAVAMTPDGQFAACGRANQVFMYHVPTGQLLGQLIDARLAGTPAAATGGAHLDLVQALAFNPTGDLLASGGYREVKLWRRPQNVQKLAMPGAAQPVRSLAVSADAKSAAIGDTAGSIKLWDLTAGKEVRTLTGHTAAVTGLRFTPDGAKLVSGSLDKTIRVWNLADGAPAGQLTTPGAVNALTLSPDGSQIVSGEADNIIRLWAFPTLPPVEPQPPPVKELKGHTAPISALAPAPGGARIISGSDDGTLRHWNLENGQAIRQYNHGGPVTAVAAQADGKRFASAGANNSAKLWNAENGQQVAELKGDFRAQRQAAMLDRALNGARNKSTDLKNVFKEGEDRAKKEAEAVTKAMEAKTAAEKTFAEKTEAAKKPVADKQAADKEAMDAELAFNDLKTKADTAKTASDADKANKDLEKAAADAKKLADESEQKLKQAKKKAEDLAKPADTATLEAKSAEMAMLSAARSVETTQASAKRAADAVPVAQAAADASDVAVKAAEAALEAGRKAAAETEKPLRAIDFSPDGLRLATAGDHNLVHTWASETGAPLDCFQAHTGPIAALAFTSGGGLISGSADKSAILWEVNPAWTLERTIGDVNDPSLFVDRVLALDFSPDGKLLATGSGEPSRSGEVKLWNPVDGTLVRAIAEPHSDTVCCVSFSPQGDMLASSAADRFVKLWTVANGAPVRSFEGHTHHVLGVAWKTDAKVLASAGADNVIKVWDVTTGDQRRTIEGLSKEVTSIHFVGDTSRTVSSSGDKNVRLHNTDSGGNERTYSGASDFVYSTSITLDGKLVLAGGQDSVLRVWNVDNGQPVRTFDPPVEAAETPK